MRAVRKADKDIDHGPKGYKRLFSDGLVYVVDWREIGPKDIGPNRSQGRRIENQYGRLQQLLENRQIKAAKAQGKAKPKAAK